MNCYSTIFNSPTIFDNNSTLLLFTRPPLFRPFNILKYRRRLHLHLKFVRDRIEMVHFAGWKHSYVSILFTKLFYNSLHYQSGSKVLEKVTDNLYGYITHTMHGASISFQIYFECWNRVHFCQKISCDDKDNWWTLVNTKIFNCWHFFTPPPFLLF